MEAGPGPRRHLEMGDTGGPSETSGGRGSGNDLPVMPGPEKPLLHTAIEFVETLDNTLAEHQMLNIAHGELPADAACIIDVPIEAVALPDPSHPQYGSALVKRLEIQTKNQSNRVRRLTIVFNSRTKLFGMLVRSAKPKNPGRTRQLGITYSKHAPNARRLYARADANWRSTRSTTGYCIFLGGAAIATCCQRQGCISMSTTEAELVALAACAIELIYIMQLLKFIGYECDDAVCVETDNKGAHDLCHRFSSAQHTRHIDRKLFKLREMRGAGLVTVKYLGTEENTADIFTKILDRQPFEKHRKTVLNAAANDGIPSARDKKAMGAWPRRF